VLINNKIHTELAKKNRDMKTRFALGFLMLTALMSAYSQDSNDELEIIQSIFGIEKHLAVAEFLQLEGGASNEFWEVYEAYEAERKALGKRRVDLLNRYVDEYFELSDENTASILKESIAINKSYEKLIIKYYKKVKKTNGEKAAAQFYQIEVYLKTYIRSAILSSIPFVGEVE
jgi:hypothetical protein